jgi:integrative and conjugative element protein (TIGR02256 family)
MGELYPSSNKIIITNIVSAQTNKSNRYNLELDIESINKDMTKIHQDSFGTITYLGDWHTHPEPNPTPSQIDYNTFILNHKKTKLEQGFSLYIILGTCNKLWIKIFDGKEFKQVELNVIK